MNSTAENIAFMIVRGIIALAIVGLGFFCIAQGIHFFALPRVEAEQIRIHFVGLDVTASGLGAVIFGTGVALCFVGQRTAPRRFETKKAGGAIGTQGPATRPEISSSDNEGPATQPEISSSDNATSSKPAAAQDVPIQEPPPPGQPLTWEESTVVLEGRDHPTLRFD